MALIKVNNKLKDSILKIILNLFLAIGAVTMVFPFFWMVVSSFKPSDEIISFTFKLLPTVWTMDHYIELFDKLSIGRAYINSFIVSVSITVSTVVFSALAGYMFAKLKFRGQNLIFYIVLLSMMVPFQIALIPLYFLASKVGLVDTYIGIIFPSIISAFGIFLTRQFITGIPDSVLDAARIDGASDFGIFYRIILPLTKPILSVIAIIIFAASWDSFLWPLVIINSNELRTLPVLMSHFTARAGTYLGPSMAASTFVIVPVIIIFLFFQKNLIKSLALSGTKE